MTKNTNSPEGNVRSNKINIDNDFVQGDKFGGDKIGGNKFIVTNLTTYKYLPLKDIAIILVITAIGTVLFSKLLPDTIHLPFPTPTAFEPATEGETLIVILPFHLTTDVSSDAYHKIYARIQESIDKLGLTDVRVEIDPNATLHQLDREKAQALGDQHRAAVIIWGTETRSDITVKFLNLKELDAPAGNEQVQIIAPDEYAEFVVEDLPRSLTFFSLFAVGQAVAVDGEHAEAISIMEEAIANISGVMIIEEMVSQKAVADAYSWLGWQYFMLPTDNFQQAVAAYEQSLVYAPASRKSLGNLGTLYHFLGKHEIAINYDKQALSIAQANGDKKSESFYLSNLGLAYHLLGYDVTAISYLEQALSIARMISDKQAEGGALGNLGLVYDSLGNSDMAISYYKQAIVIAQEIGDKTIAGSPLNNLGSAYHLQGEYEKSADYYEQALNVAQKIGDKKSEERQLGNLGATYLVTGEYETAVMYLEQALTIAQTINDSVGEGNHLFNLGVAYLNLGQYETASDYYEKALPIAQMVNNKEIESYILGDLGTSYLVLGDIETAVIYLEQAVAVAQENDDKQYAGDQLGLLGLIHFMSKEYETAASYTQQALTIFEEIGSPNATQAEQQLNDIQAEIDDG